MRLRLRRRERLELSLAELYALSNGLYARFLNIFEQHPDLSDEEVERDFGPLATADRKIDAALRRRIGIGATALVWARRTAEERRVRA